MGSQSTRDFTKVVIRQLPPLLQEADCKAAFDKEFADRYSWFSFARGKVGQKTTRASTAYLNFRAASDVLDFKAAFEGATFVDARGKQQPCSVEYAPFQRVPRGRVKRDPREGTIEKDAAYKAFLEELEKQPDALPTAEQQLDQRLEAGDMLVTNAAAGVGDGEDVRIVTPLMAYLQEKSVPKERERRKAQPRKGGASGRSLVGSALASISEAGERDGGSRKQSKAASRAAAGSQAAGQRSSSSSAKGCAAATASDSAQAAKEAALRALGSLRLESEPPAGPADSSAADGDAKPPPKLKKRDAPAKEPKVRPGFGAFVPRAARQQDGGSGSAAADDTAAASGTASAPASAARAKAAAAAAQAPANAGTADRRKRPQQQSASSQKDKQQAKSTQKQQHPATLQEQQQQQQEPRSPQHARQQRGRGHRQGGKQAAAPAETPADLATATPPTILMRITEAAGSRDAESSASAAAGASSRRHRGRGTASGREATPAPGVQGAPAAAEPAAPQMATRKGSRQRGRPKTGGDAEPP